MRYVLIMAKTKERFEADVEAALNDGFFLHGNPSITVDSHGVMTFFQAVSKPSPIP